MRDQGIFNNPVKVTLHPTSVKTLGLGHPWVTEDAFSRKFPQNEAILMGLDDQGKHIAVLLNDPNHKNIKARLWGKGGKDYKPGKNEFFSELKKRIELSIFTRKTMGLINQRQNFYIVFGEANSLPGLFVQVLNKVLYVQFYIGFWTQIQDNLLRILIDATQKKYPEIKIEQVLLSYRYDKNSKKLFKIDPLGFEIEEIKNYPEFILNEFDIKYAIRVDDEHKDVGIFTDMAAIRKEIFQKLQKTKNVLNLYSYTGAFSLCALKNGASKVVSVDLSKNYLNWLSYNISLNKDLRPEKHSSLHMSVEHAIKLLLKKDETFDLIICDPPSISAFGKSVTQAFKHYELMLPDLIKLASNEANIVIFLNTHGISSKKFFDKIHELLIKNSHTFINAEILYTISLDEDCLCPESFPEGNYLKGVSIQIKKARRG